MNERLQRLEEKIAYLERHVTEQDRAMLAMADDFERMKNELRALRERSGSGNGPGGEGDLPAFEKPPHY